MIDAEQKKIVSKIMTNISLPDDRAEVTYGFIENQITEALRDYKGSAPQDVVDKIDELTERICTAVCDKKMEKRKMRSVVRDLCNAICDVLKSGSVT